MTIIVRDAVFPGVVYQNVSKHGQIIMRINDDDDDGYISTLELGVANHSIMQCTGAGVTCKWQSPEATWVHK